MKLDDRYCEVRRKHSNGNWSNEGKGGRKEGIEIKNKKEWEVTIEIRFSKGRGQKG